MYVFHNLDNISLFGQNDTDKLSGNEERLKVTTIWSTLVFTWSDRLIVEPRLTITSL